MGVRWVWAGTVGGVGVKSVGEEGESEREIGVDRRILERARCGQENLREKWVWPRESRREIGVDRRILER